MKNYTPCASRKHEAERRENFAPKTFPKHFHTQSILVIGRYALLPSVFLVFPMKNVALNETEKLRAEQRQKSETKEIPPFFAAARRNQKAAGKAKLTRKRKGEGKV